MVKKLIITEDQLKQLKVHIQESEVHSRVVNAIKNDLNTNYESIMGVKRKGGEYINTPMIKIKIDGEHITPKALFDYMKFKYKMGDAFTKQLISDWVFGKIGTDNTLSKNVTLNENDSEE